MRLLLDECIDRRLAREFKGHFARTAPQMGWATLKNGALLSLAEKGFDVFVTVDRNLSTQQNLSRFNIAVMVLRSKSNRLEDLKVLVPKALSILPGIKPKQVVTVGS